MKIAIGLYINQGYIYRGICKTKRCMGSGHKSLREDFKSGFEVISSVFFSNQ